MSEKSSSVVLGIIIIGLLLFVGYTKFVPDTPISAYNTYRVPINQTINCDKVTISLESKWVFGMAEANQTKGYEEFELSSKPFFILSYWNQTNNGAYIEIKREMYAP